MRFTCILAFFLFPETAGGSYRGVISRSPGGRHAISTAAFVKAIQEIASLALAMTFICWYKADTKASPHTYVGVLARGL